MISTMRNHYLDSLRGWMIVFFTIGGVVIIGALIGLSSAGQDDDSSGAASALGWLSVGCGIVGFGFLSMLFFFVASTIDFRLTHPYDAGAVPVPASPEGASRQGDLESPVGQSGPVA